MGSIPLPALDVQQYQPESPLNAAAKFEQIRASRQQQQLQDVQLQQQQLQLQDQKTIRDLMPQFVQKDDTGRPTGYDWNGLMQAAQGKVLPQTLFSIQEQQSKLRQMAATATADEFKNQQDINNQLYQRSEGLKGITDPNERQQHYQQTAMWAQQHGVNVGAWPAQAPDNDHLTALESEFGMHAQALKDQETQSTTTSNLSKAASERYKEVNGVLMDLQDPSGSPKPVNASLLSPSDWHAAIDSTIPASMDRQYNMGAHADADLYLKQGNLKAVQDVITKAQEHAGQIGNETNPVIQSAKLKLAAATKAADEAITDGDPHAAAQLLISRTVAPSQLISSRKPAFAQQAFTLAHQMDPTWNATKADADYKVASSPNNVAFFGSAHSLTEPGGTLDQLEAAAKDIPGGKIPVFNSIADAYKAATGSGPIAKYASILVGVSDDYSKVMGGGQGSDTSRNQALTLAPTNASPEARHAAVQGIRGAVSSQIHARIGNNQTLQQMYGEVPAQGAAPDPFAQFGGKAR
jgi:hypothetical protein